MRQLRKSKKIHEARKHWHKQTYILAKYAEIIAHRDAVTTGIRDDGVGAFYLPSRAIFERITPRSEPIGLVFTDSSFLVAKEVFEYGYPDDSATEPQLYFHEYGYHYQCPQEQTFFRYDYHPEEIRKILSVSFDQTFLFKRKVWLVLLKLIRYIISMQQAGKKRQIICRKSRAFPYLPRRLKRFWNSSVSTFSCKLIISKKPVFSEKTGF
ncbi:hypothetical protein FJZ31_39655 [Candidatus Poribacteria bacterium]|nr:hypothetical protein [Candidatus Poribacteria bacterium]